MRFGQVVFEATRGRLSVAGRPVDLDRQCRAILATLLGEAGQDVHKDRLLQAGWPGRVVDENSLAKAIGRLRRALGEDGGALRTVHGFGYRLEVDPLPDADIAVQPARSITRFGRKRLAWVGLFVALAALWYFASQVEPRTTGAQPLAKGEPPDSIGRVLWVDDHPLNNLAEKRALEELKLAVYQVETTEEALALLAMYDYGAVISDMNRGEEPLAGMEMVRELRKRGDATPFIVYSVVPSAAQRRLVAQAGGQRAVATSAELYDAVLPLFDERRKQRVD